ncbi:MAG: Asp23/Gls24 family envelope stress response protein [Pseudonocardiaceae bacterium]
MPPHANTPDGPSIHSRLQISDTVVARVAAYYACRVPGVLRLRPDLTQTMTGIAIRLLSPDDSAHRIPTDGVTAVVADGRARINITLVSRWGHNCRDLAEQVQDEVAEQVRSYTGLPTTVSITITHVETALPSWT